MDNLLDFLEASAALYPDKPAFEDTEKSVTFAGLQARAKAVAAALAGQCPLRSAVAVCMDKGVDAAVAFMGALYAGCFYCFIDPKQPVARIAAVLSALQPAVVITSGKAKSPEGLGFTVSPLSRLEDGETDEAVLAKIRASAIDTDPAYCSFTSGSTGTPKGVLVSHRSVIDFISRFVPLFGITSADVLACQSPLDFDVSVKDIFSGLMAGATVLLIPKFYFVFIPNLLEWLEAKKATTLIWAVSALNLLSQRKALEFLVPSSINKIMFSGEAMPPACLLYWKGYYPDGRFTNLYGPTEITCNCTYYSVPADYSGGEVPIGAPIANERIFLLDGDGGLITTPGITGEICVTGSALALGYLANPDQTAAAFVQNPLNTRWRELMYRTGDTACYGADGLLYYRGRRDRQIKRHGRRVEPVEIENAMQQVEGIDRACVIYLADSSRLLGFYWGVEQERKGLNKALQALVPDYMVPDEFIFRDAMPLTDHGKLDRAKLTADYLGSQNDG